MHEMGIASSVLEAVHKELRLYPGQRATKVGLRIGEFAGVDAESLRFCFDVLVKDSTLAPLTLDIQLSRVEEGARGDELDLAYLELEDSEPRPACGAGLRPAIETEPPPSGSEHTQEVTV